MNDMNAKIAKFISSIKKEYPQIYRLIIRYESQHNVLVLNVIQLKKLTTGNGIGTEILCNIVNFADKLGLDMILTTVLLEAEPKYQVCDLIRFYSRFGFSTLVPFKTTHNMFRKANA